MIQFRQKKKRGRGGDMNSFKIKDTNQNQYPKTERKKVKFIEVTKEPTTNYIVVDKLRNIIELPKKKQRLNIMTTSNINFVEILPLINSKMKIIKIDLAFVVINDVGIRELSKYKIGTLIGREKFEDKINQINPEQIKYRYSHTKFFNITTEKGFITVISSANPSISSKIENYIIDRTKETYCFFNNIIQNG